MTLPDVEAAALRLVVHRVHPNAHNPSNQACLIMVNLVGDPLPVAPPAASVAAPVVSGPPIALQNMQEELKIAQSDHPQQRPSLVGSEEGVDAITAQRIADLQAQKAAAVAVEDYDEAKRLKAAVDRLRAVGAKMAALEARKAAAVAAEDYDEAKRIKIELERLRARAYPAAERGEASPAPAPPPSTFAPLSGPAPTEEVFIESHNVAATPGVGAAGAAATAFTSLPPSGGSASGLRTASPAGSTGSDWRAYDERPARAKGAYNLEAIKDLGADTPPPGVPPGGAAAAAGVPLRRIDENSGSIKAVMGAEAAEPVPPGPPAPAGFPSELPPPEPLSGDVAKESGPLQALIGEFCTRCMYSKSWQLREAGMAALAQEVGRPEALPVLDGSGDALRLLAGVVAQGLPSRIPAVSAAALALLRALAAAAGPRRLPPRDLHAALAELLPAVADRAADPAPRTRDQAVETLVALGAIKEAGLASMAPLFLRAGKRGEAPRATLGRIQLVSALLPVLGVATAASHEGFSAESVVKFASPALTSPAAEVRAAAAELVAKVGAAPGVGADVVLPLLPADLNPKLRESLEATLTGKAPVAAAAATGGAAAAAAKPSERERPRSGSSTGAAAARRPSAQQQQQQQRPPKEAAAAGPLAAGVGATAAVAKQRPQQQQQQKGRIAGAASRGSRRSPAAAAAAAVPPPQAPPSLPFHTPAPEASREQNYGLPTAAAAATPAFCTPAPATGTEQPFYSPATAAAGAEMSILDEDPAFFEEELRRRTAELGPTHPAVANAASNLAIVYNQKGDAGRALPLYQHALSIWEAAHGPQHPDVANALVDIAVILLEAGRETEGRGLLRRALDIQEGLLGADHPDVIAIRDVLAGE